MSIKFLRSITGTTICATNLCGINIIEDGVSLENKYLQTGETATNADCLAGQPATYYAPIGWSNLTKESTVVGCGTVASGGTICRNSFYGVYAGTNITTGNRNVAMGTEALRYITTSSGQVAVGYQALMCSSGNTNTAVGFSALRNNRTGVENIGIGDTALYCNLTGGYNIGVGFQTLYYNTGSTASNNIAIGCQALFCNKIGACNIAIGGGAMCCTINKCYDIAIGINAMYAATGGSSNIAIGRNTLQAITCVATGNVAIGTFALQNNKTGCNNVALGTALGSNISGSNNIGIGGAMGFSTGGTYNIGIGSNANRCGTSNTHYNIAMGYTALYSNKTGCGNIAIGCESMGAGTCGNFNTGIGNKTLCCNIGGNCNVALGNIALQSNRTGSGNVALGVALYQNLAGNNNVGIGFTSLASNTSGNTNIAIGAYVMQNNILGNCNIAIGCQAMQTASGGTDNIAIGKNALQCSTCVSANNIAIGSSALQSNKTGVCNIAIGLNAGFGNVGGSNNIAIGCSAMNSATGGSCNIAIGMYSQYLNKSTAIDNIGIGKNTLRFNETGMINVAIGLQAAYCNKSGLQNIAMGCMSYRNATGGSYNIAIGNQSLYSNSGTIIGTYNVAVGTQAGYSTTGSSNVFIGNCAGYSEKGSNKLYIDNSNTATPLIYGEFNTDILKLNACTYIKNIGDGSCTDSVLTWDAATCAIRKVPYSSGSTSSGIVWTGSTNNGVGTYSSSGTICSEPNLTFDGTMLKAPIVVAGGLSNTHASAIYQGKIDTDVSYGNYLLFKDEANTINFSIANGAASGSTNFFPIFNGKVTSTNPALYFVGNSVNGPSAGTGIVTFDGRINNTGTGSSTVTLVNFVSGYGQSKAKIMADGTLCTIGGINAFNGCNLGLVAPAGSNDSGDIVFYSGGSPTCEWARIWTDTSGLLRYRSACDALTNRCVYHTGNISGASVANAVYATNAGFSDSTNCLCIRDTRSDNFSGFSCVQAVTWHLKTNSTDSLNDGGTYHGIMHLTPWGDRSGGCAHQLAFTDNGNVWYRQDTTASGGWCAWKKLAFSGESSGGGITWNGSTANGVGTYVSATCICSNPNMTFNGSALGVTGTICASSCLCSPVVCSTGRVRASTCVTAACYFEFTELGNQHGIRSCGGSPNAGSNFLMLGEDSVSAFSQPGGSICIRAGSGSTSDGNGGNICIIGGNKAGTGTAGSIQLYHGNCSTAKLSTTPTGIQLCCVPAKNSGDYEVLYTNSAGCVVSGASIDISSSLGTGDLLYYNGSTISGSTFVQASSSEIRMENTSLMICSNAAKTIGMCAGTCTSTFPALTICAGDNNCYIAGTLCLLGGHGCRNASGSAYGGCTWIVGGCGCNSYSSAGGNAYGGCIFIIGGCACNTYASGSAISCGGNVIICGGGSQGASPYTNIIGGTVGLYGGYGYGKYGDVCLYAGSTGCINAYGKNVGTTSLGWQFCCCVYVTGMPLSTCVAICILTGCGRAVAWTSTSDCRCKKDIIPISNALSVVTQLDGVCYHNCMFESEGCEECKYSVGLVAQDVLPVLPEIVGCSPASEDDIARGISGDTYAINYNALTAVLVEAIKEQQAQICCLQNEINTLKNCF